MSVFLFTLLCLIAPALAQSEGNLNVERATAKLWQVIDITRVFTPQTQVHVVLEAPDKERLALTLHTESALTLIKHDVIAFAPKMNAPGDIPIGKWEDYLIPHQVKLGKTRWLKERLEHEGKEIKKKFRLFLEQKRDEETEI